MQQYILEAIAEISLESTSKNVIQQYIDFIQTQLYNPGDLLTENDKSSDRIFERHHIIPKCYRKDLEKDPNNLIYLTSENHFKAHMILAEMCDVKMSNVLNFFKQDVRNFVESEQPVEYERIRKIAIEKIGENTKVSQAREKNSQFGTRWVTNGATEFKIDKNEPIPTGFYSGRINRQKEKKKCCNPWCNKFINIETFEKHKISCDTFKEKWEYSQKNKTDSGGVNHNDKNKEKMRKSALKRKKIKCKKCGKEIGVNYFNVHEMKCVHGISRKDIKKVISIYITPWGEFKKASDAAAASPFSNIYAYTIGKYCKSNNDVKIFRTSIDSWIGKTPKELGFKYEERKE